MLRLCEEAAELFIRSLNGTATEMGLHGVGLLLSLCLWARTLGARAVEVSDDGACLSFSPSALPHSSDSFSLILVLRAWYVGFYGRGSGTARLTGHPHRLWLFHHAVYFEWLSPRVSSHQMHWMMLISRQGKVRLSKWFDASTTAQRATIMRDIVTLVLPRPSVMCNVVEWTSPPLPPSSPSPSGTPVPSSSVSLTRKLIYRRYASLYFVLCISDGDNELAALETVHLYVESLDKYFGNVCELDVIFNFDRAYFLADELFLGGHLQETNRATVLRNARASDELAERVVKFSEKDAAARRAAGVTSRV